MSTGNWKPIDITPVVDSDNADAVITIPPSTNTAYPRIELCDIIPSYSAAPAAAKKLTIQTTTGGGSPTLVTKAVYYINSASPPVINLNNFVSKPGLGWVITLGASGTGGTKGCLSASARAI